MNIGGIIGGTIAAVIGAIFWGAIAYYGEVEIGWLAIGIGVLVGFGVSAGSRSGGVGAAVVAVILTVLSLVGGKYAAVQMAIRQLDSQFSGFAYTDEDLKLDFAYELIDKEILAGKKPRFRNGTNNDTAASLADYPPKTVAAVEKKYNALSEDERTEMKEEADSTLEAELATIKSQISQEAFKASFSPFDIVFFLLGMLAAGKVALSDLID